MSSDWVTFKVRLHRQLLEDEVRENRGSHLTLYDILDGALADALYDDAEILHTDLDTLYDIERDE